MKKKLRTLRLDRETVRRLTPENLNGVAGGTIDPDIRDSYVNSCDPVAATRIGPVCHSRILACASDGC